MSDTSQIACVTFMLLALIAGFINAKAKDTAMTVYCMGVCLILGMVIF